jgi:hypothetical protein
MRSVAMFELSAKLALSAIAGVLVVAVFGSLVPGYAGVDGPVVIPLGFGHGIHLLDLVIGTVGGVAAATIVTRRRRR